MFNELERVLLDLYYKQADPVATIKIFWGVSPGPQFIKWGPPEAPSTEGKNKTLLPFSDLTT